MYTQKSELSINARKNLPHKNTQIKNSTPYSPIFFSFVAAFFPETDLVDCVENQSVMRTKSFHIFQRADEMPFPLVPVKRLQTLRVCLKWLLAYLK